MDLPIESTTFPNANLILGPIMLGNLFNWGLLGILCLQTYLYFLWFPHDRNIIKWLVIMLFTLDICQTVVSTYNTWFMMVSGWGNTGVLFITPWSLCISVILSGIISAIVQLFFAHRAWMLSKSVIVTFLIVAISLTQCISASTGAIQVWVSQPDNSKLLPTFDAFALWLSSSLACDIIIATSMVYFLIGVKPKSSLPAADALITRLINNSVQSGTITALCAGIDLTLFLKFRSNNLHDVAFFMLSKLYSNTMLANLNARQSLRLAGNVEATGTVLIDPHTLSLGVWPEESTRGEDSRGLSVLSETAREQTSSGGETEVSTPNLHSSKSEHRICDLL